ncbi:MAG TPA: ATP-binding protein [Chthoniobacterales bacterium]|jgi:signal transduction histidine kinase
MISLQEIKPRQIRALLLLLVLAPLIPTGLLLRFMFETIQQERAVARETLTTAWQDSLSIATRALRTSLKTEVEAAPDQRAAAGIIAAALRRSFDQDVRVRILAGKTFLAGETTIAGSPVAESSISDMLPGTRVELYILERSLIQQATQEQIENYTRIAVFTISANMLIAFLAGWAFLRQIRTQELKTSSLATLAHELRTPVASMRLLLDTIREGRCPDQTEYLELMARENTRLSRLVDQFLTHARLELGTDALPLAPVAPSAVVAAAEENFAAHRHPSPLQYQSTLENNLPDILGNIASLTCLLENLLDNAWKYTGTDKHISLHVSRQAGGVEFAIRDNGIGIPPEERTAIFDRFHQIDHRLARAEEGCGLGLSIVKRIIETHHGRIHVESQLGKGSTFTVWLPAA